MPHVLVKTRPAEKRRRRHDWWIPYTFVAPFGILFALFFVLPILYALWQSLFKLTRSGLGLEAPQLVFQGLGNYLEVFQDAKFYAGLKNILTYAAIQVPLMLVLALILALMLDGLTSRLVGFFRLAFFAPYAVPGIIGALLWGFLYNPQLSPLVRGLEGLGVHTDLLAPGGVLLAMVNITVWQFTGYNMLILYAGLQAIPKELYESAALDGANGFQVARFIKIPMLLPTLVLTTIFSSIGTLQLFNEPVLLREISSAVPSYFSPNLYAYSTAFGDNNYNYAAALAVILALAAFVFSFGFLRLVRRYSGV